MRFLTSLIILLYCCYADAQEVFPKYEAPKVTPEIQELLNSSLEWNSKARAATKRPSFIDNSKSKYFPAIFSQIGGSCAQSSGMRYLFTYEMNRHMDRPAIDATGKDIKENVFSYFYTWNFINEGKDQGGFPEEGLAIARNCGVMTLSDFPDQSSAYAFRWMSGYDKYINSMQYRVESTYNFDITTQEGLDNLKDYLSYTEDGRNAGHLVTFSANSGNWVINDYYSGPSETGYKSLLTKLATEGAHAMTIVGYDDSIEFDSPEGKQLGAFIVVNSYGTWYHDNGRYYLPYYFFLKERGSVILSHTATGMKAKNHTPELIFKIKLNYSSRNDLALQLGVADKAYAENPTFTFPTQILNNQGGDNPMQGAYEGNDLEIAFDATVLLEKITSFTEPKFFISLIRSERGKLGSGTIQHFSVIDYRDNYDSPKEYICNEINNNDLKIGTNLYSIATTPLKTTSSSGLTWLDKTEQLVKSTFIIRGAKGDFTKVQFVEYDKTTGKAVIRYFYQPSGSRNLKSL